MRIPYSRLEISRHIVISIYIFATLSSDTLSYSVSYAQDPNTKITNLLAPVLRMASKATLVSRIAIIGVGQVGTAAAYSIILASLATELLIVDVNKDLRDSQVFDLCDVSYCSNSQTTVRAATHQEARESDIVVITAGSKYNRGKKSHHMWLIEYMCDHDGSDGGLGETTVQHMYKKISIIRSIVEEMKPFKSDTILLVVANPVDLLTFFAYELSGLPASQVLGSGTFLDSLRVRNLLAQEIKVRSICSSYA